MRIWCLVAVLSVGGVASPAQGQGWVFETEHVITLGEVRSSGAYSPYELIRQLHPLWFSNRGTVFGIVTQFGREPGLPVYVDGLFRGGVAELKAMPLAGVEQIRFYPAAEAVIRFGPHAPFGAVEVVTRKGPETLGDVLGATGPRARRPPAAQLVRGVPTLHHAVQVSHLATTSPTK